MLRPMRRRHRPRADLFGPPNSDHWLVIESPWHQVIQWSKLPAGLDLLRYFLELLLRYHSEGWKLHEFSSYWAHFYASKEGRQYYVQITCIDPQLPSDPLMAAARRRTM